jgi:hypothetical protein
MMAPSWRCNCQSGVRRSSSSVDFGSASNLGLVIGSLSRAHWSIVKLGLLFNREFSYPLSHSALPLTCRARLLMTRVFGGACDAPGCPAMAEGCSQSTPQFAPHIII